MRLLDAPHLRDDLARAPLAAVAAAFTAGVVADAWLAPPVWFALALGTALLLAFLIARLGGHHRLATYYLLFMVLCVGAGRSGLAGLAGPDDIGHLAGPLQAPVIVRGVLTDEPRRTPAPAGVDSLRSQPETASVAAVVRVLAVITPYGEERRSGHVRVNVSADPGQPPDALLAGLHAGDEVEVSGRLEAVVSPGNPGEFDRAAWSAGRGVRARLRARPQAVRLLEPGLSPWGIIGAVRTRSHRVLDAALPPTTAPLARALLLGDGAPMRREDWSRYIRTGVVHVLAISGQHLVVLAAFLWWALRRSGVRQRRIAVAVALTLVAYALLTGARPPATRAAVIATAGCAAIVLDRAVNAVNLAALAWLAVGVWHPPDLADTGCQLSFWAACVLAWGVGPLLEREPDPIDRLIIESRPPLLRFLFACLDTTRAAFLGGAIAWLLISPLVAYHTGGFAPAALLLGPPLALLTSVALVAGFLLLVFAWVPIVSGLFAFVVHLSLTWCDGLVGLFDRWSLFVPLDPVPAWWIVFLLLGLTAFAAWPVRPGWPAAAALLWLVALLAAWNLPRLHPGMTVTFLDVGHGGCTLIELPCGRTVLYDAGSMRGPTAAEAVAGFLASRGVRRLDDVILSHADLDHFNALPGLMDRVAVGRVLTSPTFAKKPTAGVRITMGRLGTTPHQTLTAGDRLDGGGVTFDVLHPPTGWEGGDENARSLVLHVRHGPHAVLLTGDLSGDGLAALLATRPRRADVLMAPHHGSRRVDLPGLVRWCRPRLVVSCQPVRAERPLALGVPLWETGRAGAVTLTSERGLRAAAFRTGERLALVDAAAPPR